MILSSRKAFTIIELIVVASIISLLLTTILISLSQSKKQARDSVRLSDMRQIQNALEMYYSDNGFYPLTLNETCCGGWDQGPCGADPFLQVLQTATLMPKVPDDPSGGSGTGCYGYGYYHYEAGSFGCDANKGDFFILGVRDMESSGNPHVYSPGFRCPERNWQEEFDWVAGGFEGDQR